MIRDALETIGDEPLLVHEDGRVLSGADVAHGMDAVATAVDAAGADPGDVAALTGLTRADAIIATLALIDRGLVAWPLSDRDPPRAIARQLTASRTRLIVSESPTNVGVHVTGDERWLLPGAATLLPTSGTTGEPKLAVHTLENHATSARSSLAATRFGTGDAWLLSLALHHVGGLSIVFRALEARGRVLIPMRGGGIERALRSGQPSHVSLVATQLARLLTDPACVEALRGCRTVLLGGGPIPEALRRDALDHGIGIVVSYGATETTALVTAARDPDVVAQPQSAGTVLEGRDLRLSGTGEILVGGAGVFAGYLRDGEVHDVRDDGGFFATGDIGRFNGDVLFVLGRADRRFVSGGENIQPEEIEIALEAHDGVERAVVVAVPHPDYGERPVAFVHRDPAIAPTAEALTKSLRDELPGFKVPSDIRELPAEMKSWPTPDYGELVRRASRP